MLREVPKQQLVDLVERLTIVLVDGLRGREILEGGVGGNIVVQGSLRQRKGYVPLVEGYTSLAITDVYKTK